MKDAGPIVFSFDGEAFRPANKYWQERVERHFVAGESYRMAEHHERSTNTHNHFFACLNEAWQNLPERLAGRFPTAEHLRKSALIEAGFYNERTLVCISPEEALKVAAFMRPIDEFAVIVVEGPVVKEFTAQSQSYKAMGRKDFAASKEAVLEVVARMLGVELEALADRARVPIDQVRPRRMA